MKGNIIDRAIGMFNPKWGLSRLAYRRSYEAASYGRRSKSLSGASSTGPNLEITQSFQTLRNRSRHLVRNNGWQKRALGVVADNTIGIGIRPAPVGTRNQIKKIKQIWANWAETTDCDWYGKHTFYGLQRLIMSEVAESGDCLIIRRKIIPEYPGQLPIKLQVLEGDQLDHNRNYKLSVKIKGKTVEGYARLGVQYDDEDRILGYWVWPRHPYDMTPVIQTIQSKFIPKEDVIHPFEILRAGQVRGVPMGVATYMKTSDFSDYEDAQLMRQKVAACFAAFVSGSSELTDEQSIESIEPGVIEYLRNDETITFANPPKADGYDEYSRKILQGIAAGWEITYEQLTMDYSNVNFTSGRMGKIDASGRTKHLQYNIFIPQVCVPVWRWFMESVQISGKMSSWIDCNPMSWTAPRVQQLDPVKETNALIAQLNAGLTTLSEVLRENGDDPDDVFEEMRVEREKLQEMGINLSAIPFAPDFTNDKNKEKDE